MIDGFSPLVKIVCVKRDSVIHLFRFLLLVVRDVAVYNRIWLDRYVPVVKFGYFKLLKPFKLLKLLKLLKPLKPFNLFKLKTS